VSASSGDRVHESILARERTTALAEADCRKIRQNAASDGKTSALCHVMLAVRRTSRETTRSAWRSAVSVRLTNIVLWLFVINLGIAFGAGLYEQRVVVPRWISVSAESGTHWNADMARGDDTGRRFWAFVTTGPLTLLTLINLACAWRAPREVRAWWLTAAAVALVERLFTFSYFIPTMVSLVGAPDTPDAVASATRWSHLNHLRHAMVLGAWLAALKAMLLTRAVRPAALA
jgi:hypothetical protein